MAKKSENNKLPARDSAFVIPLEDGRFGACRIIRNLEANPDDKRDKDSVLVLSSAWIGDAISEASHRDLRSALHLTHHAWRGHKHQFWTDSPPPSDFVRIGDIKTNWRERRTNCSTYSGWESARIQPLAQWRWDHDRESVLAEDKIKAVDEHERMEREERDRNDYLRNITLEELLSHTFLDNWSDYPPMDAIAASRDLMKDLTEDLFRLGPGACEAEKLSVLKECIERFNEIDADMDHFIETVEREDIYSELEAVAHASGIESHISKIDDWRDW